MYTWFFHLQYFLTRVIRNFSQYYNFSYDLSAMIYSSVAGSAFKLVRD
jgi:hypothetical protein